MTMETIEDFDDESVCGMSSSREEPPSASRDEAEEVRKQSAKETARVHTWRTFVAMALFATAVVVTVTTYHLLKKDEDESFRTVVSFTQRYAQILKKAG